MSLDLSLEPEKSPADRPLETSPPPGEPLPALPDERASLGEEARSLEELYRILIDRQEQLVRLIEQHERQLQRLTDLEKRLGELLDPAVERQQERFDRLNLFLGRIQERWDNAAHAMVERNHQAIADTQAALAEATRRELASLRRTASVILALLLVFGTGCLALLAAWRLIRG